MTPSSEKELWEQWRQKSMQDAIAKYKEILGGPPNLPLLAALGRNDLFFLMTRILGQRFMEHPWLYDRCREVEAKPDSCLDLWARGHGKSTIITFSGTMQEILRNPEITIGIFSHNRGIAKGFLKQIKREFESNETLKTLYPEICYQRPERESPKWSEDEGLIVKRKGNPREATVEAWGLVDGMPTSRHYQLRIYDDVVTDKSVGTPEQIKKTTDALDLSQNLKAKNGRVKYIGTRYHFGDTYQTLIDRKAATVRLHPATDDGTLNGNPVFLSPEEWHQTKLNSTEYSLACQQLLNPVAGTSAMFQKAWLRTYEVRPETLNVYIMVDPAGSKKKGADSTAMAVVGVDAHYNKYLLDGRRHKMNLAERWDALYTLYKRWTAMPGVQFVAVGYERYGMQSDLEYFQEKMQEVKRSFPIRELNWTRDGNESKQDRVQRLVPDFKQSRFWLPKGGDKLSGRQQEFKDTHREHLVAKAIKNIDHERRAYDLVEALLEEYLYFPFSQHDDFIDALSRIYDMDYCAPVIIREEFLEPEFV